MATVSQTLACAASGADVSAGRSAADPHKHTTSPIVTGTSVVALKYKDGVMMAADTLGSYGSLSRFTDLRRIVTTGGYTLVGADGDYSDFQYVQDILKELEVEDACVADGITHSPKEIWCCMARILYHRRSKMNPLWNNLVIAGFHEGEAFLGTTDKIGTSYECDFVATGMGLHMAMPILRRHWKPNMSESEARELLESCMRTLFYRDCRTINKITFASATKKGPSVDEPVEVSTEWSYQSFVDPKAGSDTGGSW
ncbi:Proteasome subunit beta type-4 [Hondaea fermentalgiana]|uniref:Proteasome subunit beta n=1 Tax=Hondaea fermentalgiana TaxID=2315210 RepID=A0A2R5GG53_9STRA|nr:Proteasome subunit beta type-4 [Hondaea fermentalgiana]|eukprot:GBG29892.1 Proteasome subunit beta type-4 [Hondaea fermentalgiana]